MTATAPMSAAPGVSRGARTEALRVSVVIPVLNERDSIGRVIGDLPDDLVDEVVVVDNGSTDGTVEEARRAGARVVYEPRRGYGAACYRGICEVSRPDVVVFLDGDYSDYPDDLPRLLEPIARDEVEMVIGSRLAGSAPGDLARPSHARAGTQLAVFLLRVLFGCRASDLGPFRAIRYRALLDLGMRDRAFGWTVEMQALAALRGLRTAEVPVRYRERIGQSKISGTVMGTVRAGYWILGTLLRLFLWPPRRGAGPASRAAGPVAAAS